MHTTCTRMYSGTITAIAVRIANGRLRRGSRTSPAGTVPVLKPVNAKTSNSSAAGRTPRMLSAAMTATTPVTSATRHPGDVAAGQKCARDIYHCGIASGQGELDTSINLSIATICAAYASASPGLDMLRFRATAEQAVQAWTLVGSLSISPA